jgi:hypothetical protein
MGYTVALVNRTDEHAVHPDEGAAKYWPRAIALEQIAIRIS